MLPSTIGPKLIIRILAIVVVVTAFLICSYVYANQPTCPQCQNADNLLYTWKSFRDSDSTSHEFTRIGPVGYCTHYQPPVALQQPPSQFSWYCIKCKKHVLRPPNWRSD